MSKSLLSGTVPILALAASLCVFGQAPQYDLLLQGGRVIDAKNNLSAIRDVAILDGKIAAVEPKIDAARALRTVPVAGLYVIPGIIVIHVHVYTGTGERNSYAGDNSIPPDGFTFRTGVTTVADAGCAGWRNFEDFRQRIIDRSKTRVLAFLNIVGNGMRGGRFENDLTDMEAKPAAEMAMKHKDVVIGIKTAHFAGPEWTPVDHAVEAGTLAGIPVMVDFGSDKPERPISQLLTVKLRPGDIYTHCFSGLRHELDDSGRLSPAMASGRRRGVLFDVGQGGGSLAYPVAMEAMKERFLPDSISTDLHTASMNSGTKDMLNLMSEFMAMGLSLDDVVRRATWNPAREIRRESLGNLSVGSPADVAVLSLHTGKFGFADMYGARLRGTQRLQCELTLRSGKVVYDLNAISRPDWNTLPKGYRNTGDPRWDSVSPLRVPPAAGQVK
ncbi:MAG: amidohydrolase/deacetylase family metallohydrolase [Acidobacteriota bacterium]